MYRSSSGQILGLGPRRLGFRTRDSGTKCDCRLQGSRNYDAKVLNRKAKGIHLMDVIWSEVLEAEERGINPEKTRLFGTNFGGVSIPTSRSGTQRRTRGK